MNEFRIDSNIVVTTDNKSFSLKYPLLIVVALTGCICTFSVCFSMIHPEYNKTVFWSVTVFSVLCTCFLSMLPKRLHLSGYIPLIFALIAALLKRNSIVLGAKLCYNYYYCAVHNTDTLFFELETALLNDTDLSFFLCCASVVLCSLISRFLIRRTYFIVYFLLTFIPVEFGLYEGLNMNLPAILILVATWFCVLSVQLASHRSQKGISNILSASNIANCGIAGLALTIAAVIFSVIICNAFDLTTDDNIQKKRSELRDTIEALRWQDIVDSISDVGISLGLFEDPDQRKLGTKSKLEYLDEDVVQVTLSELPEQSIYLKSFTGSVYEDNSWAVIPKADWYKNDKLETLFNKFECVPQILPFMSNQSIYTDYDNADITIKKLRKSEKTLLPYASYGEKCAYINDTGSVFKNEDEYSYSISLMQDFYSTAAMPETYYYLPTSGFNFNDETTATFFKQLDADINQESLCISSIRPPFIENSKYKTQALQAALTENYAYRPFVYEYYASPVYSESLEEVYASIPAEVCEQAQSRNTLDILAAIRDYLAQAAEYSEAPGETPSTRDFINYFLLENNKGYCMHFASAGVILARYFGVPARYCEGYIVSTDMMSEGNKNEDGSVTIDIPDSASHAWCEYYIDGYGWVPYELTPGYYDITANPEYEEEIEEVPTEPENVETTVRSETSFTVQTTTSAVTMQMNDDVTSSAVTGQIGNEKTSNSTLKGVLNAVIYIAIIVVVIAILIGILIFARQYALMKRKRDFNNNDTISAVLSIYKFLMILLKYQSIIPANMQLLEFASEAREKLNSMGFDGNGAADIIRAALAADMGGKAPSREERYSYIMYVDSLAFSFSKNKNFFIRLVLKYFYHFF